MMDEGRWRSLFNDYSNPSFVELLRRESPHLVPGLGPTPTAEPAPSGSPTPRPSGTANPAPTATRP